MNGEIVYINVTVGIRSGDVVIPVGMVRDKLDPASEFVQAILREFGRGDHQPTFGPI